jgi:hypothetical protein
MSGSVRPVRKAQMRYPGSLHGENRKAKKPGLPNVYTRNAQEKIGKRSISEKFHLAVTKQMTPMSAMNAITMTVDATALVKTAVM